MGLTEFQAASYFFTQMETSKENLEPILNQAELDHFKELKWRLLEVKEGRTIGLCETEFSLIGSASLAQALAIKMGGSTQPLSPYSLPAIACRLNLGEPLLSESRDLSVCFPNQKTVPVAPTIESSSG